MKKNIVVIVASENPKKLIVKHFEPDALVVMDYVETVRRLASKGTRIEIAETIVSEVTE